MSAAINSERDKDRMRESF